MASKLTTGKIFIPGGIVSPGDLKRIANTANNFGVKYLHLGERQDIYLEFNESSLKEISLRLHNTQYFFQSEPFTFSNIVTSYPVKNLTKSYKWVTEGIYREILSSFKYQPVIKINICDPLQGMFPLFNGQLNFIASSFENYWYLYLKLQDDSKPVRWPVLVDSKEISALALQVEQVWLENANIEFKELENSIYSSREWTFRVTEEKPDLTAKRFFFYEGLHNMGENRYWLGIYERLNQYPVEFMESLASLASQTEIGNICLTPYKSLIIKNIPEKDLHLWQELLGKYKINTRHSSLEVNFRVPDMDDDAMELRKYIFDYFDNREVRSEGLVFALHGADDAPGSIIVQRKSLFNIGKYHFFYHYNVKYRKDFNINSHELIEYSENAKKSEVPDILMYLCEKYFEQLNNAKSSAKTKTVVEKSTNPKKLYNCSLCLTVYDEEFGDSLNNIPAGMPFDHLPGDYKCPLCEAPKEFYKELSPEPANL